MPCQKAKSKHLSFFLDNNERAANILELVHCHLWCPTPILSKTCYSYYDIFVDDFSRFTWFYLLRHNQIFMTFSYSFMHWWRINFQSTLKNFKMTMGRNLLIKDCKPYLLVLVFITNFHVQQLQHKMDVHSINTCILLRLDLSCFFILLFP